MSSLDLTQALDLGVSAAKEAGKIALEYRETMLRSSDDALGIEIKGFGDFVTEADQLGQNKIVEIIQATYPDHRFLAEEKGADTLGDPDCPYRWIIDPIDGTIAFIHGKDWFGTLIALEEDGEIKLGIMYLPARDELFTCIKGEGTLHSGKPVKLRQTVSMSEAILCCPIRHRGIQDNEGTYQVSIPHCGSIENHSSMTQECAEILRGHNDGMFFWNAPHVWDVAPTCLMVEEAGGRAEWELEDPDDERGCVVGLASTGEVFDELREFTFREASKAIR